VPSVESASPEAPSDEDASPVEARPSLAPPAEAPPVEIPSTEVRPLAASVNAASSVLPPSEFWRLSHSASASASEEDRPPEDLAPAPSR